MKYNTPIFTIMIITEETKKRFMRMLADRQIIVIQHKCHRASYLFKFIGANDAGKWDFTPMVVDVAGIEYNGEMSTENLSVLGKDAADILTKVVKKLMCGGNWMFAETYHEIYEKVREHITTFYM